MIWLSEITFYFYILACNLCPPSESWSTFPNEGYTSILRLQFMKDTGLFQQEEFDTRYKRQDKHEKGMEGLRGLVQVFS